MARMGSSGGGERPTIYPFPWPRLARIANLKDFLGTRRRHLDAAVQAVPEEGLSRADLRDEAEQSLLDRFRFDELVLGETTIDSDVGQERVPVTDPRMLGPGESSRVITVDLFNAVIPVSGDTELLSYWPPNVKATEPSTRAWFDPRTPCIRIPVLAEPSDPSGALMRGFLTDQDTNLRKLVTATNAAVAAWNGELPVVISELVTRHKGRLDGRSSRRDNLGFRVAPTSTRPIAYRLPRARQAPRAPMVLEEGDYPLLTDDDLAAVVAVIRRWADYIPEHPSVVEGKDEPALRDELLHNLNTKWPGTAETFSKLGRTDIRVVVEPASATGISDLVFKAECKIWRSARSATEALLQLTQRYLTNRESRAALVFFVTERRYLSTARTRAVDRLVTRHDGRVLDLELSGWPVLDVPHPDDSARTIRTVVIVIDATVAGD